MSAATPAASLRAAAACGAVVLAACLLVVVATPGRGTWVVDCGARALLAQRLLETHFRRVDLEYPGAALDPDGAAFPIPPPYAVRRGAAFFSQYPPAYPALAAPFLAALGPAGLRLPAALGSAACAALFVLWLAPVLGPRWALAGGGALGLATPLLFYGAVIWEHSLTAALPLGAVVLLQHPSRRRCVAAGALVAAACWLRAELVLMGLALAAAVAAERRRSREAALLAAGALPLLLALLGFNRAVYGSALGPHVGGNVGVTAATARAGGGALAGRVAALLTAHGGSSGEGALLALALLACVAGGAFAARRGRGALAIGIATAVGCGATWRGLHEIASASAPYLVLPYYNGLMVQLPALCLAGVGAAHLGRRPELAPLRLGVVAGLGFLALAVPARVLLTDFFTGGSWGPRMLLPGLPALAALALVALRCETEAPRPPLRALARAAAALLLLTGLAGSAVSVWLLDRQKREVQSLQQEILAEPEPVVVTDHPALGQQLAFAWGRKPLLLVERRDAAGVLERARGRGLSAFLLLRRPLRRAPVDPAPGARCESAGRRHGRFAPVIFDLERLHCRMRDAGAAAPAGAP